MTDYTPSDNPWQAHRAALKNHLTNDNLNDFMQWSTIQATMYVGNGDYLQTELDYLKALPTWGRYAYACQRAEGFGDELIDGMGANALHQAYHLAMWEQATNNKIEYLAKIVEFGGGYGEMGHIAYRLGFRGEYVLIDVEEMQPIQTHYLRKTVPFLDWKAVHHMAHIARNGECDLFIALASLSETPLEYRDTLVPLLQPYGALVLYQETFNNYDNVAWFARWRQTLPLRWKEWEVAHYKSHRYLVGG